MGTIDKERHIDLCERVHELLGQATAQGLHELAATLSAAEDAAHAQCPNPGIPQ